MKVRRGLPYLTTLPRESDKFTDTWNYWCVPTVVLRLDGAIGLTYANYNCDTGQMMWDALVVINAIKGDALFDFSPWGNVTYDEKCITTFNTEPDGHCRYQMPQPDAGWSNRILDEIRRMNIISGMCSPKGSQIEKTSHYV